MLLAIPAGLDPTEDTFLPLILTVLEVYEYVEPDIGLTNS